MVDKMISPASLCEIKDRIHTNEESKWLRGGDVTKL